MEGNTLSVEKLPPEASKGHKTNIIHVKPYTLPEDLMAREYGPCGPGTQRPVADRLLGDIAVLWYLLRVLGIVPVGRSSSGQVSFRLLSLPMLYSVVLYLLLTCSGCYLLLDKLHNFTDSDVNFYDMVFKSIQLVYILGPLLFAPLHWLQAEQLAEYTGQWRDFQTNFNRVTGKSLQFSMKTRTIRTVVLHTTLTAAVVIVEYFLVAYATVRPHEMIFYGYACMLFLLHHLLWCVLCQALVTSARQIMAAIKSEVDLTPALVAEYSTLWLQLASLTEGVGDSLGLSLGDLLLSTFANVTMAAYGTLYGLVSGLHYILATLFVFMIFTGGQIKQFCDMAEQATNEVGDIFLEKLRRVSSNNKETQKALTLFLHTVASDRPAMSLSGFVTIRKKLLTTLLTTTTAYLIVLMQFGGSINVEPIRMNETNSSNNGWG